NRSTVNRIIKLFRETGKTESNKRGGNRRTILNINQKAYIRYLVDANPSITLNAIVLKIQETFQPTIDDNIVDRCLKQFHYSLKQLVVLPKLKIVIIQSKIALNILTIS
ncbi:hypothetical protein CDIK_2648, partial [Cucumispora dikerogammari]